MKNLLLDLPVDLLLLILEWDVNSTSLDAHASVGCTCKAIADENTELWLILYRRASGTVQTDSKRLSRSVCKPRVAVFKCVALSAHARAAQITSCRQHVSMHDSLPKTLISNKDKREEKKSSKGLADKYSESSERWLSAVTRRYLSPYFGDLLLHAAYLNRNKAVKALVTQLNVDKNYRGAERGDNVIIIAAWSGNSALLEWLLNAGNGGVADVLARGGLQKTSLCGGVGPFTALTWAKRKADLVQGTSPFSRCAKMLERG